MNDLANASNRLLADLALIDSAEIMACLPDSRSLHLFAKKKTWITLIRAFFLNSNRVVITFFTFDIPITTF